jgi:very-short-patch-repair endonuclease
VIAFPATDSHPQSRHRSMDSTPLTYARAKAMRREPTCAERKLWGALRKRTLGDYKFVRQQPIGPYIVDFLCRKKMLIVEVDGATHCDAHEIQHDERRTNYLKSRGYSMVRVDNPSVYTDIGSVLDHIHRALVSDI